MLCYIRAHDQKAIRGKLIGLYALNVSDALLTYWLIGTGYFLEANFLLKNVVLNFEELFLIKILLPAALIAWLYYRVRHATEKQLKPGNIVVNSVLLLYIFVNFLHLVWVGTFLVVAFVYAPSMGFIG